MSKLALLLPASLLIGLPVLFAQPGDPAGNRRPFLGVAVGAAQESGEGVAIRDVAPDSPAAKAGLKRGDVVLKLDGKNVTDVPEFLRTVGSHKVGDKVNVEVRRDGKDQTIAATLAERPAPGSVAPQVPPGPGAPFPGLPKGIRGPVFLGVDVQPLTAESRQKLKVKGENGVVVVDVVPGSPAEKAGLKREDVITRVNGQAVKNANDLRSAVQTAGAGKDVTLALDRGGEQKDVKVALQQAGPGIGGFPPGLTPPEIGGPAGMSNRIRSLERRIDELEKRLNALEKQKQPVGK